MPDAQRPPRSKRAVPTARVVAAEAPPRPLRAEACACQTPHPPAAVVLPGIHCSTRPGSRVPPAPAKDEDNNEPGHQLRPPPDRGARSDFVGAGQRPPPSGTEAARSAGDVAHRPPADPRASLTPAQSQRAAEFRRSIGRGLRESAADPLADRAGDSVAARAARARARPGDGVRRPTDARPTLRCRVCPPPRRIQCSRKRRCSPMRSRRPVPAPAPALGVTDAGGVGLRRARRRPQADRRAGPGVRQPAAAQADWHGRRGRD